MKKIIALLIALTMISSFLPTVALADAPEIVVKTQRNYNFDDIPGPEAWTTADLGGDRGNVYRHPEAETTIYTTGNRPEGSTSVIETYIGIIPDEEGNTWEGNGSITFFYYGNKKAAGFARNSSGYFAFMGSSTGVPMEIGRWYHVKLEVPQAPAVGKVTITDDEGNKYTYEKTSIYSDLYRASFSVSSQGHVYTTDANLTFYDDFKLYYTAKPYTTTVTAYDRAGTETTIDDVDYVNPTIKVDFSEPMKNAAIEGDEENLLLNADVKLLDEEGNEVPFTGTLDAATKKSYTIKPEGNLVAKANYKLVFDAALSTAGAKYWSGEEVLDTFEIPFTVSKKDLSIENVESVASGDTVSYNVTIRNKTGENKDAYIVVARYDGEKLVAITTCPVTGAADGVTYENITLSNLGTEDAVILIDADGSFRTQDIWGK